VAPKVLAMTERRTIHFRGKVQGVGFRYSTQEIARLFEVTGYVQNLPDGRVRLVIEGEPGELDRMLRQVNQSLGQYIADQDTVSDAANGEFDRFEIRG